MLDVMDRAELVTVGQLGRVKPVGLLGQLDRFWRSIGLTGLNGPTCLNEFSMRGIL